MISVKVALWIMNKGAKLLPEDCANEAFIVNCIRTKKITFESEQQKDYMDIAEDICNKDK